MIDIPKILHDFQVPTNGEKRGYTIIHCPWCGDTSWHGGLHQQKQKFTCWKCKRKPLSTTLQYLTGMPWQQLKEHYRGESELISEEQTIERPDTLIFPEELTPLTREQRQYLLSRDFDTVEIIDTWDVRGTTHIGMYSFRIFIPIYFNNNLISYTCRDWTGLSSMRYFSCDKVDEVICHKDILYGIDKCTERIGVIVEGPTDVWRLGPGSCATFGTGYTLSQLLLIRERFDKVFIVYDPEAEAQKQALKMGSELSGMGVEVENIVIAKKDPGSLTPGEGKILMGELLG